MAQLSPLTPANITARANLPEKDESSRVEEVTMYRCTVCGELHEREDDAIDCCARKCHDEEMYQCPVCGQQCSDNESAAHCCLWKDLNHAQRCQIATKVEAGSTWTEAISSVTEH